MHLSPTWVSYMFSHVQYANFLTALPHRLTEEDTYEGYRIPKNATVIANTWAVLHDPELYPEPFKFDPGRFLVVGEHSSVNNHEINPDSRTFAYGFGRRQCPGM